MKDSFWKLATMAALAGLFYIGHGLHTDEKLSLPTLSAPARADGLAFTRDDASMFVTATQNGDTVYLWRLNGGNHVEFLAQARIKQ